MYACVISIAKKNKKQETYLFLNTLDCLIKLLLNILCFFFLGLFNLTKASITKVHIHSNFNLFILTRKLLGATLKNQHLFQLLSLLIIVYSFFFFRETVTGFQPSQTERYDYLVLGFQPSQTARFDSQYQGPSPHRLRGMTIQYQGFSPH